MSVLIIQHADSEGPGLIGEYLEEKGRQMKIVKVPEEIFPDPTPHEAVVILGGPQSANDKLQYLRNERMMIRRALMLKKPILGICLGAQLIASIANAKVYPNKVKEFGITLGETTPDGREDKIFGKFPRRFPVMQWHGETFDIPSGAKHLVRGASCVNQAFSYKTAYALQFHLELTEGIINAMTVDNINELEKEGIEPWEIVQEFQKSKDDLKNLCMDFCKMFFQ